MSKKYKFGYNEGVELEDRLEAATPSLYKVFLINDDYTTMDFVIYVLEKIFNKRPPEATRIMLHVHKNGEGLAGVYTKDIAETKISKVHEAAKDNGYPLRCTLEKE